MLRAAHSLLAAVAAGVAADLLDPRASRRPGPRGRSTVIMPEDLAATRGPRALGLRRRRRARRHCLSFRGRRRPAGRGKADPAAAYDRAFRQIGAILGARRIGLG